MDNKLTYIKLTIEKNKTKRILLIQPPECEGGQRVVGTWMQFGKIGDRTKYFTGIEHNQFALDIFYDLIKISNNKHLNTKLF